MKIPPTRGPAIHLQHARLSSRNLERFYPTSVEDILRSAKNRGEWTTLLLRMLKLYEQGTGTYTLSGSDALGTRGLNNWMPVSSATTTTSFLPPHDDPSQEQAQDLAKTFPFQHLLLKAMVRGDMELFVHMVAAADANLFAWTVLLAATPNNGLIPNDFCPASRFYAGRFMESQVGLVSTPEAYAVALLLKKRHEIFGSETTPASSGGTTDAGKEHPTTISSTPVTGVEEMVVGCSRPAAKTVERLFASATRKKSSVQWWKFPEPELDLQGARNVVSGVLASGSCPGLKSSPPVRARHFLVWRHLVEWAGVRKLLLSASPGVIEFLFEDCRAVVQDDFHLATRQVFANQGGHQQDPRSVVWTQLLYNAVLRAEADGEVRVFRALRGFFDNFDAEVQKIVSLGEKNLWLSGGQGSPSQWAFSQRLAWVARLATVESVSLSVREQYE